MANKQIDELTYASTITDATSIPVNNNTATYEAQQLTVGKLGDFLGSRANAVHNLGDVYNNKSSLVIDNPGALPAWTGEYVTNANNVYPDLYTWLKTAHPELCVTRAAYDAAITADGECKYFVIDEEPGSIRFPKYNYTAPDYPWIYCFNAAVPQTTTQGAEYTASLISKVSKAGDTMTGQLVMANGSNGIKFQGTNDNSYYVNLQNNILMATLVSNVGNLVSEMLNPVGTVIQGPITSAPTGYLLCNGQAVDRTTYSKLFDVIGTNFGSGDGSTTFNVPDYRGCFLRGLGGASGTLYAKQEQGLPNITGGSRGYVLNGGAKSASGAFANNRFITSSVSGLVASPNWNILGGGGEAYRDINFDASLSNPIYGSANENRPDNFAVQYFIKY